MLTVLNFFWLLLNVNNQSCWSCSPEMPLLQLILLCEVRKWMKTKSSVLASTSSAASSLNKITKMICFQII